MIRAVKQKEIYHSRNVIQTSLELRERNVPLNRDAKVSGLHLFLSPIGDRSVRPATDGDDITIGLSLKYSGGSYTDTAYISIK